MSKKNRMFVLPYSGRRYSINPDGEVVKQDGGVIVSRIVDGHKVVELEWIYGKSVYKVGTLVLFANGYFRDFPEFLLSEIDPLYKDSDPGNTRLENLTYRFKNGPLEVEDFPGYFYIPFYTRYAISRNGEMITAATGAVNNHLGVARSWSILPPNEAKGSPGGYRYLRAVTDNGDSKILFRHQALCWTFKNYEAGVRGLVCNHLNGVPGDDRLENLELTTYRENNIHAVRSGLRKRTRPILMVNLDSGIKYTVRTVNECLEKDKGLTRSIVVHRLSDRVAKRRVYSDFWVFRREGDTTPLPEYIKGVTEIHRASFDRAVIAKDIHSGVTYIETSYSTLGAALNIPPMAIRSRVVSEDPRPFKGYCFKYLDDKRGWPVFTERQLEIHLKYRHRPRTPDGVIVTDLESGDELFFCSREEAARHFQLSPTTVHTMTFNGSVLRKRFKFEKYEANGNILWSH